MNTITDARRNKRRQSQQQKKQVLWLVEIKTLVEHESDIDIGLRIIQIIPNKLSYQIIILNGKINYIEFM